MPGKVPQRERIEYPGETPYDPRSKLQPAYPGRRQHLPDRGDGSCPRPGEERLLQENLAAGPVESMALTNLRPDYSAGAGCLSEISDRSGARLRRGSRRRGANLRTGGPAYARPRPGATLLLAPSELHPALSRSIAGRGSIVVTPPEGGMGAYIASLERVRNLSPACILPGHGPEMTDGAAKVEEYTAHRKEREARIIAPEDGVPP